MISSIALAYLAGSISGGKSRLGSPLIGLAIGSLIGLDGYWLVLACVAGWAGEKPSPAKWSHGRVIDGQAGKPLELDVMKRKAAWFEIQREGFEYVNLAIRGLINAVPYLPFYFAISYHAFLPLLYAISWPLGAYLATIGDSKDKWNQSEGFRQLICAALIALASLV